MHDDSFIIQHIGNTFGDHAVILHLEIVALIEPLALSWRHLGALLFQPSGMALLDGLIERITLLRA